MFSPIVCLPSLSEICPEKDARLKSFVQQLGIVCPVMLQPPFLFEDEVPLRYLEYTSLADCCCVGVPVDRVDVALKLLDGGMHMVFLSKSESSDAVKDALASFPRSRIGLASLTEPSGYGEVSAVVDEFSVVTDYYIFK